jgi:electron transport complex protein RnfB
MKEVIMEQQVSLINHIEQLLPQTQCGQCGFGGCRPYATALVEIENTPINLCPPGGTIVIEKLQQLKQAETHLKFSTEKLTPPDFLGFQTVSINESHCIGCTLCLDVCPTDAIIGSPKHLHRVIDQDCTGCGLCIPACPVDCITWNIIDSEKTWNDERKNHAFNNHQARKERLKSLQKIAGLDDAEIQLTESLQGVSERIPTTLFDVNKIKSLDKKGILSKLKNK